MEEEREGGTGPRGRDRGGERPPGVAVWVTEGIIRVVLGVADSPCGCGEEAGAGWKRKGKGERDPEGGIGGERDPREWRRGLQKVLSG